MFTGENVLLKNEKLCSNSKYRRLKGACLSGGYTAVIRNSISDIMEAQT